MDGVACLRGRRCRGCSKPLLLPNSVTFMKLLRDPEGPPHTCSLGYSIRPW